jgi:SAM-dependent methyltransferase
MLAEHTRARADGSGYSASGFIALYDAARPRTPEAVIAILQQMTGTDCPASVVDLGCGTGLSTRAWTPYATTVIDIEPNDAMRQYAAGHPDNPAHLHYRAGFAHATVWPTAVLILSLVVRRCAGWSRRPPLSRSREFCVPAASLAPMNMRNSLP